MLVWSSTASIPVWSALKGFRTRSSGVEIPAPALFSASCISDNTASAMIDVCCCDGGGAAAGLPKAVSAAIPCTEYHERTIRSVSGVRFATVVVARSAVTPYSRVPPGVASCSRKGPVMPLVASV